MSMLIQTTLPPSLFGILQLRSRVFVSAVRVLLKECLHCCLQRGPFYGIKLFDRLKWHCFTAEETFHLNCRVKKLSWLYVVYRAGRGRCQLWQLLHRAALWFLLVFLHDDDLLRRYEKKKCTNKIKVKKKQIAEKKILTSKAAMLEPPRLLLIAAMFIGSMQDLTTAMALTGAPNLQRLHSTFLAWEPPPPGYDPARRRQKPCINERPTWPPTAATSLASPAHDHKKIINNSTFVASWLMTRAERKEMKRTIEDQECIIKQQEESLEKLQQLTTDCLRLLKLQDVRRLGNQLLVAKIINLDDLDNLLGRE